MFSIFPLLLVFLPPLVSRASALASVPFPISLDLASTTNIRSFAPASFTTSVKRPICSKTRLLASVPIAINVLWTESKFDNSFETCIRRTESW